MPQKERLGLNCIPGASLNAPTLLLRSQHQSRVHQPLKLPRVHDVVYVQNGSGFAEKALGSKLTAHRNVCNKVTPSS
jgi:hypothetical protein